MSGTPVAPAFLPNYKISSDLPILLCNSTAMSFPLAQNFCGMPPPINPSHAPPPRQPITGDKFILPHFQPKNLFKQDAETLQCPPGSSSLQHQAQCQQAFHQTIQQFHQQLKAEQIDRKTLQLIVLLLQNDFALLRYLLFSSVGTISISDTAVKNSATSPLINLNPNPTPTAL